MQLSVYSWTYAR